MTLFKSGPCDCFEHVHSYRICELFTESLKEDILFTEDIYFDFEKFFYRK